jgi:ABC-2 type transport system permease protein
VTPLRLLRVLLRMLKLNVMLTMEYRLGFFIMMGNTVLVPAIGLLVWLAVSESDAGLPYTRDQLVTYFVLMGVVSMLTGAWTSEYVQEDIRFGELNKVLVRPAPHYVHYVANNLGEKVVKAALLAPPLLLLAIVFRQELRLSPDPARWLLFAAAVVLACALSFLIDYSLGSLAFWLQDVSGVVALERLLYGFLAGRFIPLAMFPPQFAGFLEAQPFRYVLSFPLEILTGDLSSAALARGLAWQAAYCAAMLLALRLEWRYGLRAYGATGA